MQNDRDRDILTRIFCLPVQDDQIPQSWKDWEEGRSNYKPLSLQFNECKENGTVFTEYCNACGHKLIMCHKYGGQCISGKCKDTRIRPENKQYKLFTEKEKRE